MQDVRDTAVGAELIGVNEADREVNVKAMRMCEIRLDPSWLEHITDPRKQSLRLLRLEWNPGVQPGMRWAGKQRRVLRPGDTTLLDIGRAQSYFGLFTVPTDVQDVIDENKSEQMWKDFRIERDRAVLTWGDFQKGALMEDADTVMGPARMPDVWVTVIESNGDRWQPIRIRELYELGDYVEVSIPRSRSKFFQQQAAAAPAVADERVHEMEKQLAEMRGMMHGVIAMQQQAAAPAPQPKAKSQE